MKTLDVVNEMLGTMGETPLNTLDDPHAFRGACLSTLARVNREVQAKGWWFNSELLTLSPSALDSSIYLPGDCLGVRVPRKATGASTRNYVKRGRRLYDTGSNGDAGTYVFTADVTVDIFRLIPFEDDLDEVAANYIASQAVLQFQSKYDGDTAKGRELEKRISGPTGTFAAFQRAETQNQQVNMIESNVALQRLKRITRGARYGTLR